MATLMVQVGEPGDASHGEILHAIDNLLPGVCLDIVVIGNLKPLGASIVDSQPQFAILDELENLLVEDGVLVAYNEELLLMSGQLAHILAKKGERRICNHHVGLL